MEVNDGFTNLLKMEYQMLCYFQLPTE